MSVPSTPTRFAIASSSRTPSAGTSRKPWQANVTAAASARIQIPETRRLPRPSGGFIVVFMRRFARTGQLRIPRTTHVARWSRIVWLGSAIGISRHGVHNYCGRMLPRFRLRLVLLPLFVCAIYACERPAGPRAEGPQGPQGPQGPAGPQGPTGPQGASSLQDVLALDINLGSITSDYTTYTLSCPSGATALVQSYRFGQQELAFQITESYPGRIDGLGAETWKIALTRVSRTLRTPTLQVYLTCVTPGDSSGAYTPQ